MTLTAADYTGFLDPIVLRPINVHRIRLPADYRYRTITFIIPNILLIINLKLSMAAASLPQFISDAYPRSMSFIIFYMSISAASINNNFIKIIKFV